MACTPRQRNWPSIYRLWRAGFIRSREAAKSCFGETTGLIAASCGHAAGFWLPILHHQNRPVPEETRTQSRTVPAALHRTIQYYGGNERNGACRGPRASQPFTISRHDPVAEAPELPIIFQRAIDFADRHVDGHDCRGVAGLPADGIVTATGHGGIRRANSSFSIVACGWDGGGSFQPSQGGNRHAGCVHDFCVHSGHVDADEARDGNGGNYSGGADG